VRTRAAYITRILRRGAASFLAAAANRDAAQVAFFLLMSCPALLLLLTWAFSTALRDPSVGDQIVGAIVDVLPLSSASAREQVTALLDQVAAGAGGLGAVGAVALLYSASAAIGGLRHAVNMAFGGRDPRPYVPGKALDVGLTLVVAPTMIVALGLSLSGNLASAIGDRPWINAAVQVAVTDVLPLLLIYAALVLLLWVLPFSHAPVRTACGGAFIGLVGILLVQAGTQLYYGAFGRVNALYGTLGILLALVFSAYLAAMVVVYGAHVTAAAAKGWAPDEVAETDAAAREPGRPTVLRRARRLLVRD